MNLYKQLVISALATSLSEIYIYIWYSIYIVIPVPVERKILYLIHLQTDKPAPRLTAGNSPTCCFFPCCTCCASWRSEFCVYLLGMLRSIMVVTLLLIGNKSAELSVHPINPSFGHRTSPTSPLFCRLNATASTIKRRWSVASDVVH